MRSCCLRWETSSCARLFRPLLLKCRGQTWAQCAQVRPRSPRTAPDVLPQQHLVSHYALGDCKQDDLDTESANCIVRLPCQLVCSKDRACCFGIERGVDRLDRSTADLSTTRQDDLCRDGSHLLVHRSDEVEVIPGG